MKTLKARPLWIIIVLAFMACSSNDDNHEEAEEQRSTYINYSVAGNQVNNTFNIVVEDTNNTNIMASTIIYPESDSETLKAAGISYLDYSQLIGVAISIPAILLLGLGLLGLLFVGIVGFIVPIVNAVRAANGESPSNFSTIKFI